MSRNYSTISVKWKYDQIFSNDYGYLTIRLFQDLGIRIFHVLPFKISMTRLTLNRLGTWGGIQSSC